MYHPGILLGIVHPGILLGIVHPGICWVCIPGLYATLYIPGYTPPVPPATALPDTEMPHMLPYRASLPCCRTDC